MDSQPRPDSWDTVSAGLVTASSYTKRVVLKSLVGRSDGGLALVGQRVVIGGWVKSSKEVKKEQPPPAAIVPASLPRAGGEAAGNRDVTCTEIIQSRITIFRKIINALSGATNVPVREKTDSAIQKPTLPSPSTLYFLINDGSCVASLQVVVDSSISWLPASQLLPFGTCIVAEGILREPSSPGKHVVELKTEKLLHIGTVDPDKYPLSKKQLPLHVLRDHSHFRPRTTTVASVTRVHSALNLGTHKFFQDHGFQYVQVPIITSTDAEGFSEMFQVTTLFKDAGKEESEAIIDTDVVKLDVLKAAVKVKSQKVEELKRSESNREALVAAIRDLNKTNELASQLESRQKSKAENFTKADKSKIPEDFFSRQAYLTVSGRLHLESYACALGNVYTFGPRFRADKVENVRHVAEMWNVESEMAFSDLEGAMNCAYDYFKFLCKYILENCSEDIKFISKRVDKNVSARLELMAFNSIAKLSYAEAVALLQKIVDKTFETKPELGMALTTEHLSYLADEVYKGPMVIYNYPKAQKPFYVRLNDDGNTVAAFDVVVPTVGILITGSQDEERFDKLFARIKELSLPKEQYEWYLDLRRHGTVKHAGFSLRFDLMVLYVVGLPDVRDSIPFPRRWGKQLVD
ncbi:asparagine--tRNA ligase, cytoplasmic 2 isoform X1 [Carica papaya]|uniref:asparagine--tRNA ligase, cytoplasmic 2 isoform X1 n=1 Tax=Carica papaya TaxID=3649 RepID=UPI000B8C9F9C|nr:asparagine--tRNA ligase, cytoplasmic 2 isoform X1 [Carica papaya]